MKNESTEFGWCRDGMRTRYRPKAPLCRGLLTCAPWVDIALIVVFFLLLDSRAVMKPGVVVELPETKIEEGTRQGLTAVIVSHEGVGSRKREEMVFFDDDPFIVRNDSQMSRLTERFAEMVNQQPSRILVVEADVNVRYGTIVRVCNMAREAGFRTVNLAERLSAGGRND